MMILPPDEIGFSVTKRMKEISYTQEDANTMCEFAMAVVNFRLLNIRKNYFPLRIAWQRTIFVDRGTGFVPVQT